jgi:uncharacterized protein GlcG (DUF336 family)
MIALDQARIAVEQALAHARRRELPPMTVAVLDAAGRLVAFAREERSSLLREDIAQAKARGALNLGIGSRAIATRAAAHPHFISALTTLASGDLVPVPGGVLIRDTHRRDRRRGRRQRASARRRRGLRDPGHHRLRPAAGSG